MFDITEYIEKDSIFYNNEIENLDDEIDSDISRLLIDKSENLYASDKYKYQFNSINILYPKLKYPGTQSLILNPDRIKFLLSFYPYKGHFKNLNTIILRPRYIESDDMELVSLYLKESKTIVLYLTRPHHYFMTTIEDSSFISTDLDRIFKSKLLGSITNEADASIKIHPLWYVLSTVATKGNKSIDKFFIKNDFSNIKSREILSTISYFYSRNGY